MIRPVPATLNDISGQVGRCALRVGVLHSLISVYMDEAGKATGFFLGLELRLVFAYNADPSLL